MANIKDIDEGTIRRVDWLEILPPTIFFRAFSATFKFSLIAIFALLIAGVIALRGDAPSENSTFLAERPLVWNGDAASQSRSVLGFCVKKASRVDATVACPLDAALRSAPAGSDGKLKAATVGFVCLFLFLSLVAARSSVVRLATSARSSTLASIRFAFRKIPSLVLVVATPCLLGVVIWTLTSLVRATGGFGAFCAPLTTLFIVLLAITTGAAALGTPLAISALATENCDGYDAISRGVSYATQRLLAGLIYTAIALLLLKIGFILVAFIANFSVAAYDCAYGKTARPWLDFWRLVLAAIPWAYLCHSSVVYASAIYLLLRRSVDGTPYDSCALGGSAAPRRLRKIIQDSKGAPVIVDPDAAKPSNAEKESEKGNEK